jgi:hypothetical protein
MVAHFLSNLILPLEGNVLEGKCFHFLSIGRSQLENTLNMGGDGHLPEWNFVGEGEDLSDPSVESENSFQAKNIKIRYLTSLLTVHVGLK